MRVRLRCIAFLSLAALLLAAPLAAQEARGTIQGTVTDPQGAIVPGATVTVTNTDTRTSRTVLTSDIGYYEAPFLDAGTYSVTVELSGFKKSTRTGVVLNAGLKVVVNVNLEVGLAEQTVTVTEAAPLLETTSASAGRVIDTKMMESLPFSDLNPFALTGMASGMQWTGQPEYRRPFDNGGTSSFTTREASGRTST